MGRLAVREGTGTIPEYKRRLREKRKGSRGEGREKNVNSSRRDVDAENANTVHSTGSVSALAALVRNGHR